MALQGTMMTLTSKDGAEIGYYHVKPAGARKGGLVCIMEIFGVTDHIKEVCDGWAAEGYEVVSPQLYDREEKNFQSAYSEEDIQQAMKLRDKVGYDHIADDVQAGIDFLKAQADGPVFVTGYCYGGSATWVAACRCDGLAAASCFYGRQIVDFADESPNCPTIMHFGEHDESIPMKFVNEIAKKHPELPIHVYDAGHGFCSDRPTHYNAEACKLARERSLKLFAENG